MSNFLQHWQRVTRAADGRTGVVKDIDGVSCHVVWDDDQSLTWEHAADLIGGELTPAGRC